MLKHRFCLIFKTTTQVPIDSEPVVIVLTNYYARFPKKIGEHRVIFNFRGQIFILRLISIFSIEYATIALLFLCLNVFE